MHYLDFVTLPQFWVWHTKFCFIWMFFHFSITISIEWHSVMSLFGWTIGTVLVIKAMGKCDHCYTQHDYHRSLWYECIHTDSYTKVASHTIHLSMSRFLIEIWPKNNQEHITCHIHYSEEIKEHSLVFTPISVASIRYCPSVSMEKEHLERISHHEFGVPTPPVHHVHEYKMGS